MDIELKPCPFCGGEAELLRSEPGFEDRVHSLVICRDWNCPGNNRQWEINDEEAAAVWNTRAERTCRMDYVGYIGTEESHAGIYQCSKCSMRYMSANVPDSGEYCMACGAKVVDE